VIAPQNQHDDQPEDKGTFERHFASVDFAVGSEARLGSVNHIVVGKHIQMKAPRDFRKQTVHPVDSHTDLLSTSIGSRQSIDRRKEVVSLSPFSQGHWC
jgi:hypothetical protein